MRPRRTCAAPAQPPRGQGGGPGSVLTVEWVLGEFVISGFVLDPGPRPDGSRPSRRWCPYDLSLPSLRALPPEATLVLEDGAVFRGEAFAGAPFTVAAEVVFNTAMTGYQEVLTDPSYRRQIVCMAAPEVGNYGTTLIDAEVGLVQVAGFVVRQAARRCQLAPCATWPRSWTPSRPGRRHQGIDTRRLVRHLREAGALRGALSTVTSNVDELRLAGALEALDPNGHLGGGGSLGRARGGPSPRVTSASLPLQVVLYDFGIKRNIVRLLARLGRILVVPASARRRGAGAGARRDLPSNGPGDPATVTEFTAAAELLGQAADLRHLPRPPAPRVGADGTTWRLATGA